MRERRRRSREMSVPLSHPPGRAQCGFGEARVIIGGVERKARCFVLDLREIPRAAFGSALPAAPGEGHQMQEEHE